jgi:hypothetical protein
LLGKAGFANVIYHDMLQYVWPSIERIDRLSLLAFPLNVVKVTLGIARKNLAARYQKRLFRRGVITYGVYVATKPEL